MEGITSLAHVGNMIIQKQTFKDSQINFFFPLTKANIANEESEIEIIPFLYFF